jgi:hypothetical protein
MPAERALITSQRARDVYPNPARELQDLGIADRFGVDERVCIFYIDFAKLGRQVHRED